MYRSRQSRHRGRLKFGRPAWYEIREARELHCRDAPKVYLRWIGLLCSRTVWRINFTFNNYSKHNYDIAGDVDVQGVLRLPPPPARPSDVRPPVLNGHLPGPKGVRSWQVLLYMDGSQQHTLIWVNDDLIHRHAREIMSQQDTGQSVDQVGVTCPQWPYSAGGHTNMLEYLLMTTPGSEQGVDQIMWPSKFEAVNSLFLFHLYGQRK